MNPPFTAEQFLDVMARYNHGVSPMPVLFYLVAAALVLLARRPSTSGRAISGILAFLWAWMGVVYHWLFFTEINPAARLFGALFVLQAAAFLVVALRREPLRYRLEADADGITGGVLVGYALVLYPLLGALAGHGYPEGPTFGLPCPTTIATFGILLWARDRVPWWLVVIPAAWASLGFTAALRFGITEDYGLPVAAVVAIVMLLRGSRRAREQVPVAG